MARSSQLIQQFARAGALARLNELKAEIADIERAFPDLGNESSGGHRPGRRTRAAEAASETPKRKRRKMSAAARKAIGDAQRKRWAEQKAQAGQKR